MPKRKVIRSADTIREIETDILIDCEESSSLQSYPSNVYRLPDSPCFVDGNFVCSMFKPDPDDLPRSLLFDFNCF
jgi:hypothetical protein